MAVILWAMGLSLLMQGCLCSLGQTDRGCMKWIAKEDEKDEVCCEACHPGNRLVIQCGRRPEDLCTPCEPETFTVNAKDQKCTRCTQCVGAQVLVKACTATNDTQCGCIDGLTCGNSQCSFCVKTCGIGEEPTTDRSCRPCPVGTFNNQIHQMCKPWKKCPNLGQYIEKSGDASHDIVCGNVSIDATHNPNPPGTAEPAWLVISVLTSIALISFSIIVIVTGAVKILQKRKKTEKAIKKTPIIRTPTDEPMTLRAIECSFHEAQQEQGSSSESLNSKDSSDPLIV
ncbi:tumor necrosis factor receptor superfamily member 9-like [Seriola lalandi dorsalis]|uniref:Tumor necrosis factor receptor superfamily, member 9a n=1 Tax=Seriola lalandi dorsalis TaxID=1841481 RepID=A0A3B4YP70_SERLL|nr:tumor necrosis factor receptor superfamily member 9-like [Seriola lalandi dorsalis]XP_056241044.1 tumor necrosis factor receptor superfamily member 9-like [Seriola aureovittata]